MLLRRSVVWLFALAILLGIPTAGTRADFGQGPALLDSSHALSLLPFSEPSLNSLRPLPDNDELPPPQVPILVAVYSVGYAFFSVSPSHAPITLCRGIPTGRSPPLVS